MTEIPLPKAILRAIANPSLPLLHGSAVGKIVGFKIQTKGRKGSRSVTSAVSYGRLGAGDSARSPLDYGKSYFVGKKGSTGVKVWVGYAS